MTIVVRYKSEKLQPNELYEIDLSLANDVGIKMPEPYRRDEPFELSKTSWTKNTRGCSRWSSTAAKRDDVVAFNLLMENVEDHFTKAKMMTKACYLNYSTHKSADDDFVEEIVGLAVATRRQDVRSRKGLACAAHQEHWLPEQLCADRVEARCLIDERLVLSV